MHRRTLLVLTTASVTGLAGCTTEAPPGDTESADDQSTEADSETNATDDSSVETESTDSVEDLEQEDIVDFVNFDPVVNEVFVGIVADLPVDEVVLSSAVANEETHVGQNEGDEVHSVPVDHQGDMLSVIIREDGSETKIHEEEWSPPTADDFEEELLDEDNRTVEDVEIIEQEMGYAAQVNFVAEIEAIEIQISSTVARGEFSSDSLAGLQSGTVQINAVEDEVTVRRIDNNEEEIIHREHLQP